jgi:hypothetical protein
MYEYYTAYKKAYTAGDHDTAAKFSHQLRWEIARHAVGEELVVYPLMEEKMGDKGKKLADHDREEHQVRSAELAAGEWLLTPCTEREGVATGDRQPGRLGSRLRPEDAQTHGAPQAPQRRRGERRPAPARARSSSRVYLCSIQY